MTSRRSRRIRVAFFAMNLLPSLHSRWTQLVLPSPQLREEVPHLALDRAGALWVGHPGQGARQIAGVDPVPRAVDERRSRALDAARDRLVGRVAVVIDVLAVEVLVLCETSPLRAGDVSERLEPALECTVNEYAAGRILHPQPVAATCIRG